MARILANDGLHQAGLDMLREAGFEVVTDKVEQSDLPTALQQYDAILVRSATTVRQDLIDACPNLSFIGRGGVGMDNIDVDYARSKGIRVENTPAASSQSVAELVMGHFYTMARSLHDSNRKMPAEGGADFKMLKKAYGKGAELSGKTLGIVGMGRIGRATAALGLGAGMRVIGADPYMENPVQVDLQLADRDNLQIPVELLERDDLISQADFISLHIPFGKGQVPVIDQAAFGKMKQGVYLANAARGGVVDEDALLAALESGKVAGAALDVFVGEPTPRQELLHHPSISLTPHIGAATVEAQARIGTEMAGKLIEHFSATASH